MKQRGAQRLDHLQGQLAAWTCDKRMSLKSNGGMNHCHLEAEEALALWKKLWRKRREETNIKIFGGAKLCAQIKTEKNMKALLPAVNTIYCFHPSLPS